MTVCPPPKPSFALGFTLLELLVAMSIFSVLGLGSYQLLQTVGVTHDKVRETAATYTELNLAMATLQRDFNQFVYRPVRDGYGEPLAPILFGEDDYAVEFTRAGWSNPAGRPRSRLQRVAYRVDYDSETLIRSFWTVLDRAEDSEPVEQVLLNGVTDFMVTGFVADSVDTPGLDEALDDTAASIPVGVEVVIAREDFGEIKRIFQLVDPFQVSSTGGPGDETGDMEGDEGEQQPDQGEENNPASPPLDTSPES